MEIQLPVVTVDDLHTFHAKHFSHAPLPAPGHLVDGAEPAEEIYDYHEEDDGLGYYEDGAKRTLTDEQIALFRHTEIQNIIRERIRKREASSSPEPDSKRQSLRISRQNPNEQEQRNAGGDEVQDGYIEKQTNWTKASARTKAKNKKNRERYRAKLRKERKVEKRKNRDEDEESDEWDPWHQATGPDVQKDTPIDLEY